MKSVIARKFNKVVSKSVVGYDFLAIDIHPPFISSTFQVAGAVALLGR